MARLFVTDDAAVPLLEINEDDDGFWTVCDGRGERIEHHRQPDLIEAARIHVDQQHP